MKYMVKRTSALGDDKPCEGYVLEKFFINGEEYEDWFIEINTIEDLNEFIWKYGSIIIEPALFDSPYLIIEIYDDYRE